MQSITLYRYLRPDGGVTTSVNPPDGAEYTTLVRLVADDGMALINGDQVTTCIDTNTVEGWEEIPMPEEGEATEEDIATEEDYKQALRDMGVDV